MTLNQIITHAANGQRDALVALVGAIMATAGIPDDEKIAMAEPVARLAAAHGMSCDLLLLAGILHSRAANLSETDPTRANVLLIEVMGLLDRVVEEGTADELLFLADSLNLAADAGDEVAAIWLERLVGKLPSDVAAALNQCLRNEAATQPTT